MKFKKFNDEVFYPADAKVQIDAVDIEEIKQKARQSPRRTARFCAHSNINESIHEMLIVHQKSFYVRPHKHENKTISFHIIEGEADIILFHDDGTIDQVITMGDKASGRKFFYRLTSSPYYTKIIHSDMLVFHETISGPFRIDETMLAPWSPKETDINAVSNYMALLSSHTKNHE